MEATARHIVNAAIKIHKALGPGLLESVYQKCLAYELTRGKNGMCLVGGERPPLFVPARAREIFDVSGAGDTVIATLAAGLAGGLPVWEATQVANIAAGIVVGKVGTQPIAFEELKAAIEMDSMGSSRYPGYSGGKVAALGMATVVAKAWRNSGLQIVFTNGCFDLLHPGHINLLHQARALGGRLVVGLNTDSSVRRLNGPSCPILSENDRATILAALSCVDLVVLFDEDTPLSLIEALRPDVLVKGSDYRIDQVVGRETVEGYGGRVELIRLLYGHSTTAIANKIFSRTEQ